MEATVTIKATPEEFRLLRRALEEHASRRAAYAQTGGVGPRDKAEARKEAQSARALLEKL